ncbi:hypothetical protein [Klebsiella aerogenes]|uniref:hypothetical protein n=1 Tax=Klebsiella aerogenes TaxID=548 RepID=UPI0005EFBACD|nr:hypothetical protein [Klebsiella aerogenes]ELA0086666.1 type III secretion system protein [Klebsiella aerogenes]ELA0209158.1 type III secretion system protein [Klebsiella aerogenes]ELA0230262.1 type III secretion system protein [Klebsiella aerogenes]KJO55875.1 hypothetical protein SR89_17820 [Klebsiella aerogenes]KLF56260.1 hypothetical protein YA35_09310 [Klebsiella aerogenes]
MSSISSMTYPRPQTAPDSNPAELNFNDKVLLYIQQHQPQGSLNELLQQMRALSPDEKLSMHQLNNALLSADAQMRKDDNYSDYTDSILDKLTTRLVGVNMLFNDMMNNNFSQTND